MSEPDIVTRRYMANPERFADAFNYAVYGGEQVINPRELVPLDTVLTGKTNKGSSVERRRDGLKRWQAMCDDHTEYAILGIEDQTYLDAGMPVRGMLYDALSYQDQLNELKKKNKQEKLLSEKEWLSGIREDDRILPVATLVVYFGSDEWVMARSVHELLKTHDARLLPFIPDYRINIITPST